MKTSGPNRRDLKLLTTLLLVSFCWGAAAVEKTELDRRAQMMLVKFESLQSKPDKHIPPEVLRKAKGIILLDRTKAGFIFAYQGGSGIAMVKDKKGQWSPLAFMKADEASLGFQVGGQQSFFAILLMNEQSAKSLIAQAAFEFGGEARGTAGSTSAGQEADLEDIPRSVMIYDERSGLFGGAAIKGGAIHPDYDANRVYYGPAATMQGILLNHKYKPTEPAAQLAAKIREYSKAR
jgi:SH3 domain-containing YSC84-like protein 1